MISAAKSRASGLSVGKNSTMHSQSFSSCQNGSKSSLRFVPKTARSPFSKVLLENSQYTDDTQSVGSFVLPAAIYRALRRDRCLVITT
jgi:hypothetical protein